VIVKAMFYRNGVPAGRAYTYLTPDDGETYKQGDLVYLKPDSIGQIVQVDVPEDQIGFPVEKLKAFIGRAVNPEIQIPAEQDEQKGDINGKRIG